MPTFISTPGDEFVVKQTTRDYGSTPVEIIKVDGKTGQVTIQGVVVDTGLVVDQTARDAAAAAQTTANTAETDAQTGITNAAAAQSTADTALTNANTANANALETAIVRGTDLINSDATLAVAGGNEYFMDAGTLTATRTLTLSPTGATAGEMILIVRQDSTAHQLVIVNGGTGGGTLYTFPNSQRRIASFVFDGTDWGTVTHAARR